MNGRSLVGPTADGHGDFVSDLLIVQHLLTIQLDVAGDVQVINTQKQH